MSLNQYTTERLQEELERRAAIRAEAEGGTRVPTLAGCARMRSELAAEKNSDPWLMQQVSTFTQTGNTLGTTADNERLDITLHSVAGGGEFFELQTATGWSFDEIDDLVALLEKAARTMKGPSPAASSRHLDMS